jgi:hypothetical protein
MTSRTLKAVGVGALVLLINPATVLAQGRGKSKAAAAKGIPPGHLPPPGECRVWYEGVPPGHQPPATSCGAAEATARQTRSARVIYGAGRKPVDVWHRESPRASEDDNRDRADRERNDRRGERSSTGRAVPRDGYEDIESRNRRIPDRQVNTEARNRHPGWSAGYRDGRLKGREDAGKNRSYDPKRHQWYRSASRGYDRRYGLRGAYANIYREGFDAGYAEEFRPQR